MSEINFGLVSICFLFDLILSRKAHFYSWSCDKRICDRVDFRSLRGWTPLWPCQDWFGKWEPGCSAHYWGCMLIQVQRHAHTIIFCDIYLAEYNPSNPYVIYYHRLKLSLQVFHQWCLSACSLLCVVCGVHRVFTDRLFGTFNSSNMALTPVSSGYLRMICFKGKRQTLAASHNKHRPGPNGYMVSWQGS